MKKQILTTHDPGKLKFYAYLGVTLFFAMLVWSAQF